MSTQLGAQLALNGPVRATANAAAFAFSVTTESPNGTIQVDVIDTFKFDADGKVIEMCAYWGQSNVKM
jgi:steroid delta-isomerase